MELDKDPKAVVEAFDLNYNVGTVVDELLKTSAIYARTSEKDATSLRNALFHLLREMQRRGVLPSNESAAHDHADAERTDLGELAKDIVREGADCELRELARVGDQSSNELIATTTACAFTRHLENVLRGLVVQTHRRSRDQLMEDPS